MERAEEIKESLKQTDPVATPNLDALRAPPPRKRTDITAVACCGGNLTTSTNSYDFSELIGLNYSSLSVSCDVDRIKE
jgi:hypothetical protein